MTQYIAKGEPGDKCVACQDAIRPAVRLCGTDTESIDMPYCVLCLARWIDAVTGWRMAVNVVQALAVGNAGERFHHPERFAAPPRRYDRQSRLGSLKARSDQPRCLLQYDGDVIAGESQ